ncbi:hypothetical protein Sango_3067200 [Sesamum angolense]|uniref:Reverse transcriptase domain-containing protein n=1 Tax=Sesamum angolense TaxID=2727404 RepID=A0AAE1T9H3_9LAMI|nr:hypothetical protein Sango_3067200 [Sesamum angolense]
MIDYSQNAFVPGRSISDNILLAQELLASYNQARLPARCMLKVDIQKAYDSVEWDFLLEILRLFNFPQQFITLIERCVSTASFSISLNGLKVNPSKSQIILSRAVQQERQQILEYVGFQEGSLPVKYLGSGNAKVAWDQLCKPKAEGGLGIRSLITTNQALILKQLWRILQNDGTLIWWIGSSKTDSDTQQFGLSIAHRTFGMTEDHYALIIHEDQQSRGCLYPLHFPACFSETDGVGQNEIKFQWPYEEWQRGITWASKRWRGNHLVNVALRATLAALVYPVLG